MRVYRAAFSMEGMEMAKVTLRIEGMSCGMCEAHICDTIRGAVPSARKVTASRSRKEASFLTETPVDAEMLKDAITATGYLCLSVESLPWEKKSWFRK